MAKKQIEGRPWESGTEEAKAFLRSRLSVKDVMARSGLSRNSVNAVMIDATKVLPSTRSRFLEALRAANPVQGFAESVPAFAPQKLPAQLDPGRMADFEHRIETLTKQVSVLRGALEEGGHLMRGRAADPSAPVVGDLFDALERLQLEIKLIQESRQK